MYQISNEPFEGFKRHAVEQANYDSLCRYLTSGQVSFFVGNGFSRFSGAPSWEHLVRHSNIDIFRQYNIDYESESLLELCDFLHTDQILAFESSVIEKMRRYVEATQSASYDSYSYAQKAFATLVRLCILINPQSRVYTANVDYNLERCGIARNNIEYIHGEPGNPSGWIFSGKQYWENYRKRHDADYFDSMQKSHVILYFGYGHSYEDFDIIEAHNKAVSVNEKTWAYTIIPWSEARRNHLGMRLTSLRIKPITIPCPPNVSNKARDLLTAKFFIELDTSNNRDFWRGLTAFGETRASA